MKKIKNGVSDTPGNFGKLVMNIDRAHIVAITARTFQRLYLIDVAYFKGLDNAK
jgi:hypothetical protein